VKKEEKPEKRSKAKNIKTTINQCGTHTSYDRCSIGESPGDVVCHLLLLQTDVLMLPLPVQR